jgi:hypothetical protein
MSKHVRVSIIQGNNVMIHTFMILTVHLLVIIQKMMADNFIVDTIF